MKNGCWTLSPVGAESFHCLDGQHIREVRRWWGTSRAAMGIYEARSRAVTLAVEVYSCVTLSEPHGVHQAPLSTGFSRQEYWSGLPFPPPGDLPDSGIEHASPALAGGFFTTEPPGKLSWASNETWSRGVVGARAFPHLGGLQKQTAIRS